VPQYKVAAEKVHALLLSGEFEAVGLADPAAKTLDDLQIISLRPAGRILDAYQIKWGGAGGVLKPQEFTDLMVELVEGRRAVLAAQQERVDETGDEPVARAVAHLYTSKAPSTASRSNDAFEGGGRTVLSFIEEVWLPAQRELLTSVSDVEPHWHAYLNSLAAACQMDVDELLASAADLRIETSRQLAEEVIEPGTWRTRDHLQDLLELRGKLQDLVSDRHEDHVWITASDLLDRLGPAWTARWHPRSQHQFPIPEPYEPLEATVARMREAIDRFDQGYVVLTGSPGSGKSTLLTHLLRADARLAARYYAYVPDDAARRRSEAEAFLHDLLLALSSKRGHLLAPRSGDLGALGSALKEELDALGDEARQVGQTQIIVIDGLDHVGRDPLPHHPLLAELPPSAEIPEGVLFVLGTRSLDDLPSHVRQATVGARRVSIEPLSRAAVIRIAQAAELGEVAEILAARSGGHPLLLRIYMAMAKEVPAEERTSVIASRAPASAELRDFYDGVWEAQCGSPELVQLMGLISRIRGTIRLPWLLETGSAPADIERLKSLAFLFEHKSADRWRFFHTSFQEYLKNRTSELDGEVSAELGQQYHSQLAQRCQASPSQSPERFDRLHHLAQSGELQEALNVATPALFREQADRMRPRAEIQADIQGTARALAECHDPRGATNLALAASELQVRGYQYPETTEYLRLLVEIGQPELALAHLGEIDNGTVGHDRRETAMRLALLLEQRGLATEAQRLFESHEPLEWFGAQGSALRPASGGARPGLWAWAEAAARIRGASYVIETLRSLRPPNDLHRQERLSAEEVTELRCDLLWIAGHELIQLERWEEAGLLRAALEDHEDAPREDLALLDLRWRAREHRGDSDQRFDASNVQIDDLPRHAKVELALLLVADAQPELAQSIFDQLDPPALPGTQHYDHRDQREWGVYFAYWKLASSVRAATDPVDAVGSPEKEHLVDQALAARHLVAYANLEASGASGAQIEALVRRMHAFWETSSRRSDLHRPGAVRALISRRAIALAAEVGETPRIQRYFQERWGARPEARMEDGLEVIRALAEAGAGQVSVRRALDEFEAMTESSDSSPDEWVNLGLEHVRLGDIPAAERCAGRAVGRTLSLSSEKDLQLSTWTKLIDPLLKGEGGDAFAESFAAALIELDEVSYGGSPEVAARLMVEQLASDDLGRAWRIGRRFVEADLLQADAVLKALLLASAPVVSAQWWITLCELVVVFGVDPPANVLEEAIAADGVLARQWWPALLHRVATEGRPSARRRWFSTAGEAARKVGLDDLATAAEAAELGSDHSPRQQDPEPGDDGASETSSAEELLRDLEKHDSETDFDRNVRALSRRIDQLNEAQLRRLLALADGRDAETGVRAALVARAARANDSDGAWEHGIRALAVSQSGDWQRHWAGGPILDVIAELQGIDRERTKVAVYKRFAALAQSVEYFLGTVGGELDDYVVALEIDPADAAVSAWEMAGAILREVSDLPGADVVAAGREPRQSTPEEFDAAFEAALEWLLGSPYVIAWQAAQRAILAALARGLAMTALLSRALRSKEPDLAARACAIIETAAASDSLVGDLGAELTELASSDRLSLRASAIACLQELGAEPPVPVPAKQLPPRLRLELPPSPGRLQIASGIRAFAAHFREEVERLSQAAGVDEDALLAAVLERAEQIAGSDNDDEALSRRGGLFGFGYLKPSARALIAAIDEAAATLVDAERVEPSDAMRAASLWPAYDSGLLRLRPLARPEQITSFLGFEERTDMRLYERTAADLGRDAVERAVTELNGWTVLGEWTELVILDRLRHYERRVSAVTCDRTPEADEHGQHLIRPWPTDSYRRLRVRGGEGLTTLRPSLTSIASPDSWLALHPGAALALGLSPDPDHPLDWNLGEQPAVQSLWWRSGYTHWNPYSDEDEVGWGWLLLATPEVIESLRERGRLQRWVNVWSGRFGDGDTPADDAHSTQLSAV
jgi:hypothetical protein